MLLESELLCEEDDRYALTEPMVAMAIPETLQDSLMARLDQIYTAKEVAQLGSVLGREFSYEMLEAISPEDEKMLQTGLAQLVEAELLYQRGRPPRSRYIFKHALIQDAAYASLLRPTRQDYHQRIAQVLLAQFPNTAETQPELLAYHYTGAGQDETAVSYWQRAGQYALQRSAYMEAIVHLKQGLILLASLPETQERMQQELELQIAFGNALIVIRGNAAPEVESAYARARELCGQVGQTPHIFPALRGLMLSHMNRGDVQTAIQLGDELLSLAQAQTDPAILTLAHHMLGVAFYTGAQLVEAHEHHRQVLTISRAQEHREGDRHYDLAHHVRARSFLAIELWPLGYPNQALQHSQEAMLLAQEEPNRSVLALTLGYTAFLHQWRREPQAVQRIAEMMITLATEHEFALQWGQGQALRGWALAMQGRGEQGIAEIRQGLACTRATGDKAYEPHILGLLAEAYGESGHPEEGLTVLTEAAAVLETTESCWYESELHRLKGELLLRQSVPDSAQAETFFHQALDVSQHQKAKSWELRDALSLARLWQSQNKNPDAYDLLAAVHGWFTEGFETADLQNAKSLLDELA